MGEFEKRIIKILREYSFFRQVINNGFVMKEFDELIIEAKQECPTKNQLVQLLGYLCQLYEGWKDEESQRYYVKLIKDLIDFHVRWFGNG